MPERVMINGKPVQAANVYRRSIPRPDGDPLIELEMVVILRGGMAHRAFQALLRPGRIVVATGDGGVIEATVEASQHQATGVGEAAAFRHDLTLRETPGSADRRATALAATAVGTPAAVEPTVEMADDPTGPADLSSVTVTGSSSTWATALRLLTTPSTPPAAESESEPPLGPVELTGAEAVLVGLRLEALVMALDAAGVVRRSAIDDAFLALIESRFVNEATPVIGSDAARQAMKGLLG